MQIYLLGATGRVGQEILKEALDNGHRVSVLIRSEDNLKIQSDLLTVYEGDALNEADIMKSMAHSDVVISALNTDKNDVLSKSMPLIIKAMTHYKLSRIVTIGTAGILNDRAEPDIYRFQSSESKRTTTHAAEDHLAAYLLLEKSNLNWTVVCPTYLPDGDKVGGYRTEVDFIPDDAKEISVGDTASFAYSLLSQDKFIKQRVAITY